MITGFILLLLAGIGGALLHGRARYREGLKDAEQDQAIKDLDDAEDIRKAAQEARDDNGSDRDDPGERLRKHGRLRD